MALPLHPPFPPMEAKSVDEIPTGPDWQYEPKWDGFRCLIFRDGPKVELQSKSGRPLTRYFPEIVAATKALPARRFVLDGELAVASGRVFPFPPLLARLPPGGEPHRAAGGRDSCPDDRVRSPGGPAGQGAH